MAPRRTSPPVSIIEVDASPKKKLLRSSTQRVPEDSDSAYHHNIYGVFGFPLKDRHVGKKYQAKMPPLMSIANYCKVQMNPHYQNPLNYLAIPVTLGHEMHQNRVRGSYFVPGFSSNPWDKKEQDLFILGLYVFGKDFDKVKNFIGKNKTMAEILSFYYEKYCQSVEHLRWKQWWQKPEKPGESKKPKKKESIKRVFGEHIFQQPSRMKFMSRIKLTVPKACYMEIIETLWFYQESMVKSFEECVLKLMDYVELSILIEAIGIGKGKEDLTAIAPTSEKSTNVRKVPDAKDCSMLTHREVVNILKSYTSSKPRSKNLFWKAVWPRLLDRGWRFEKQMDNENHVTKLFFFVPGVEPFSENLEKGKHYFVSTGDVLQMVASNPELMELPTLEVETNIGSGETMSLDGEDSAAGNFHSNPNHIPKTKASTDGIEVTGNNPHNMNTEDVQGNDINGKKPVSGEEVMPSSVNTKAMYPTAETFDAMDALVAEEALESQGYHPPTGNRRKKRPHRRHTHAGFGW